MPPKKKGKKKKDKQKPPGRAPGGMTLDQKYQATLKRIETLQDHLVLRSEMVSRSNQTAKTLHNELMIASSQITEEQQNTSDIACTLKRDYSKMETDLSRRISVTKSEKQLLEEKLALTQAELMREKAEKVKIVKEKDEIIADLRFKISHMESAFENILHDAFDLLVDKVEIQKSKWEKNAFDIQSKNKEVLLGFGLYPLDI